MMLFEALARRLRGAHSSWRAVDGAALLLRGVLGFLFVGHGAQKLFGWFGGAGIEGTTAFFKSIGIPAPHFFAVFVGLTELGGGLLIAAGLLTVAAAVALIGDMLVAIVSFTGAHGFFVAPPDGGWELNFVVIGLLGGLAIIGAGAWSVDRVLGLARDEAPPAPARFSREFPRVSDNPRLGEPERVR
jgi:putative oxidoreductase